jgi:hypothetical protein
LNKIISKKQILGLYICIIGLVILIKIIFPFLKLHFFLLFFLVIISLNIIISSFTKDKNKRYIIPGLTILFSSIFLLLYFFVIEKYINLKYIWPILGLFPSISLIIYYLISNKKSPHILIPGIFIGFLSIILLLNTTGIMIINFSSFLLILISFMLIITGLYLVFHDKLRELKKQKENNNENL